MGDGRSRLGQRTTVRWRLSSSIRVLVPSTHLNRDQRSRANWVASLAHLDSINQCYTILARACRLHPFPLHRALS